MKVRAKMERCGCNIMSANVAHTCCGAVPAAETSGLACVWPRCSSSASVRSNNIGFRGSLVTLSNPLPFVLWGGAEEFFPRKAIATDSSRTLEKWHAIASDYRGAPDT
jgi:hypothetical protein